MTFMDIFLVLGLVIIVTLIIFSSIKNKGNKCNGCSYSKSCDKSICNKKETNE